MTQDGQGHALASQRLAAPSSGRWRPVLTAQPVTKRTPAEKKGNG